MLNTQYTKNYFCNSAWRTFLNDICKEIDLDNLGYQIISPFGFEVFENKKFLNGNLKRFYCYIGIPKYLMISETDLLKISQSFSIILLSSLPRIGIATEDIAIIVTQDKFKLRHGRNYKCNSTDRLIDIQVRAVEDDILTDYAKYIICTIDSILSKKEEPSHFYENKRHRCRTYQLYVMLEQIFNYLLPPLSVFQRNDMANLFCLIDNSIQMFYNPSEILIQANNYDTHLLKTLIAPRVALISESIKKYNYTGSLLKIKSNAYHAKGKLEVDINDKIYQNALHKIKSTYLEYL